ncbi:hypothetical protein I3843_09G041200 [Carya illinoinensis]|nr:hypothetical protein I3843_09G041200 [Carya illinoinensis]KAG7961960.1 hypothetical protein I3843_09G041200 [Carya illinoinensis]
MSPAAVNARSPISASSVQNPNPNPNYSFNFSATASSDFTENTSTECDRGAPFASNVARAGLRARPRFVKVRKQLGSQQERSTAPSNEVGLNFNPFRHVVGRVGDGASTSNGVSESSSWVSTGSSASKGFSFSNGDIKHVNSEGAGFVFGANRSVFDANLGYNVRGMSESVGDLGSEDEGKVKYSNGTQLGEMGHAGFVFGAKQSGIEPNSYVEKRRSGNNARKSVVDGEGIVETEPKSEHGKFHDDRSMLDVDQSNLALKSNAERDREYANKSGSEGIGKAVLETETKCGKHDHVVFGTGQSDLPSIWHSEKGESGENPEKPDHDEYKVNMQTETMTNRCAGQSKNSSLLDSEDAGILKTRNEAEFGKHDDLGFVFGSSWFSSVSKNLEMRESGEMLGKLGTEEWEKVKGESGVESHKMKVNTVSFDTDVDKSLKDNIDQGVFVFGSGSKTQNSEIKLNDKHSDNCESIKTQANDLGFDVEVKGKSVFGDNHNVESASGTSPLYKLPDELKKLNIDDSKKGDGTHKSGDLNKNLHANSRAAFVFKRIEKTSGSFDKNSSGFNKNLKAGQFPQGQANDDTQQNASIASSSFSSNGLESQPNGSASEINFVGGRENKDGNRFTSIPRGLGVPFTTFSEPKWDPSCFKGNLYPEINKNASVKKRLVKDKRSNKTRGKSKLCSLNRQKPGQDHVQQEISSENPDSPGCYSPMDFSPYQETTAADPFLREANVTSQEFSYLDTDLAPSTLHSRALNDTKDEDLGAAEGLDVNNTSEKKSREQNEVKFCYQNGSGAGVMSTGDRTALSSNTERQENNCRAQFHSSSSMEKMEKIFTFSASSFAQGSLSATRRQQRKKSKGKVGRDSSVSTPSTNVNTRSSSAQLSPITTSHLDAVDKSEVHEHSQGDTSFSVSIQETCDKLRLRGNQAYRDRKLSKAEDLYTQGIVSVPSSERSGCCLGSLLLCYSNRAATRMLLGRIREALGDCMMAIALDPNFLKAQMRAANCHLVLGEVEDALRCFNKCLESGGGVCLDRKVIIEAADGVQKAQKVAKCTNRSTELLEQRTSDAALSALEIIDESLSISLYSEKLLEMKAEALYMLRKYEEVIQLCERSLSFAEKNFASLSTVAYVEGSGCQSYSTVRLWRWCLISKCYFHMGRLEAALDLLQKLEQERSTINKSGIKSLELSISLAVIIRELLRCKKAGNEAFQSRKYNDAIEYYTIALSSNVESRPFAAICLCNRAAAYQALGQTADAIADCSLAIALDGNYAKAFSRRATLHEMIRDYKQAASDLRRLISIHENQSDEKAKQSGTPGRSTSSLKELREAQRHLPLMEEEAKKGIPLDLYLILGIKPSDTAADIKKAYRKAALRHHPDKAGQFLARSESGDEGRLWKEISQEIHKDADRLFKMIGEAYAVLSDTTKRSDYDIEEGVRKAPKESRSYRRTSDVHSSQFERTNRGNRWENWKTYGNSHSRW